MWVEKCAGCGGFIIGCKCESVRKIFQSFKRWRANESRSRAGLSGRC